MIEVCAAVEPFRQPSPARNPGGDCFACVFAAAMRHLFPNRAPTFDDVYSWFIAQNTSGGEALDNTWTGFARAIFRAREAGYAIEDALEILWGNELLWGGVERFDFSFGAPVDDGLYVRRLEGYLRGGWLAITTILFDGSGPVKDGRLNVGDHFVLLDGVRYGLEDRQLRSGGTARGVEHYVHVVCSSRGAYWARARDFLIRHGARSWRLVRRDEL